MEAWSTDLEALQATAWSRLAAATTDRAAALRFLTLATIGQNGPEARTVVLRAADRSTGTLQVYTDLASGKIPELRADARASLLGWDPAAQLQVRMAATTKILTGNAVARNWESVPPVMRSAYGGDIPARPLANDTEAEAVGRAAVDERLADPTRFAVLRFNVQRMDLVHLGQTQHRRALVRRVAEVRWEAVWVVP